MPENNELIKPLLDEIISTQNYLKNNNYYNNDSMFEERLKDLEKCLLRDGFEVKEGIINPVEEQLVNLE